MDMHAELAGQEIIMRRAYGTGMILKSHSSHLGWASLEIAISF